MQLWTTTTAAIWGGIGVHAQMGVGNVAHATAGGRDGKVQTAAGGVRGGGGPASVRLVTPLSDTRVPTRGWRSVRESPTHCDHIQHSNRQARRTAPAQRAHLEVHLALAPRVRVTSLDLLLRGHPFLLRHRHGLRCLTARLTVAPNFELAFLSISRGFLNLNPRQTLSPQPEATSTTSTTYGVRRRFFCSRFQELDPRLDAGWGALLETGLDI